MLLWVYLCVCSYIIKFSVAAVGDTRSSVQFLKSVWKSRAHFTGSSCTHTHTHSHTYTLLHTHTLLHTLWQRSVVALDTWCDLSTFPIHQSIHSTIYPFHTHTHMSAYAHTHAHTNKTVAHTWRHDGSSSFRRSCLPSPRNNVARSIEKLSSHFVKMLFQWFAPIRIPSKTQTQSHFPLPPRHCHCLEMQTHWQL